MEIAILLKYDWWLQLYTNSLLVAKDFAFAWFNVKK